MTFNQVLTILLFLASLVVMYSAKEEQKDVYAAVALIIFLVATSMYFGVVRDLRDAKWALNFSKQEIKGLVEVVKYKEDLLRTEEKFDQQLVEELDKNHIEDKGEKHERSIDFREYPRR